MAQYEFQADDGEIIIREYPMTKAPKIGKTITHKGKKYSRIISTSKTEVRLFEPNFVSHSLPRWHPDAPHYEPGTGKPCFQNMREIREFSAKTGYKYEYGNG